MIYWHRTAELMPGKIAAGIGVAIEITNHVNKHHKTNMRVCTEIGGSTQRIVFASESQDLGELEGNMRRAQADPALLKLYEKWIGLVVPGSWRDTIWSMVPLG